MSKGNEFMGGPALRPEEHKLAFLKLYLLWRIFRLFCVCVKDNSVDVKIMLLDWACVFNGLIL